MGQRITNRERYDAGMSVDDVRLVAATIRGRVLVREAAASRGIFVGFHGYMENASIQMERLAAVPGAEAWTLVSIQGLSRFYKGRSEEVVASWMTRQDREAMIEDNISYVDAALDTLATSSAVPVVMAGFSQGVAMAFRAAVRGRFGAAGVVAVGGDVPPELTADPGARFPAVVMVRGERDEWFTQSKLDADVAALTARGVQVRPVVVEGGHEWTPAVTAAAGSFLRSILAL
jgi:predicted esterase